MAPPPNSNLTRDQMREQSQTKKKMVVNQFSIKQQFFRILLKMPLVDMSPVLALIQKVFENIT